MNYEEVTYTSDGVDYKSIILDLGDGAFKSFPADESNPEYCAWAIAEGLMEAPVVVEPEVVEPEPVIGTDPEV